MAQLPPIDPIWEYISNFYQGGVLLNVVKDNNLINVIAIYCNEIRQDQIKQDKELETNTEQILKAISDTGDTVTSSVNLNTDEAAIVTRGIIAAAV